MISDKDTAHLDLSEQASGFASTAAGLIRSARHALESEVGCSGGDNKDRTVLLTLELAEMFAGLTIEGMERMRQRPSTTQVNAIRDLALKAQIL